MCQNNYNRKKEEKKYKHLNYVEKTCMLVNDVVNISLYFYFFVL